MTLNFSAASQFGGGGTVALGEGHQVAIDSQGDTFLAGNFTGQVTFGKDSGGNVVSVNNNDTDVNGFPLEEGFVVEYSPSGVVDWFTRFQPDSGSQSTADSLAIDPSNGTLYVVGSFEGTVNFDPAAGDTFKEFSSLPTATDVYAIGLSQSSGQVTNNLFSDFAETFDSSMFISATEVKYDSSSNAVYVAGNFTNGFLFTSAGPSSGSTGFVAKLNANNLTTDWAVDPLDENFTNNFSINGMATNAVNSVDYIVGDDAASGGTTSLVEQLNDSDGSSVQMAELDSTSSVTASDVAVSGNVAYVVGTFSGSLDSSSFTQKLNSFGTTDDDAFIVELDGSSLAEKNGGRFGSAGEDSGDAVAIDGAGNVYMSGEDQGPDTYGTAPGFVLNSTAATTQQAAYVTEFSPSLAFATGAQSIASGANGFSEADSLAVSSGGKLAIAGGMSADLTFGATPLTSPTSNGFVATLTPSSSSSGGGGGGGGNGGGNGGGSTTGTGTRAGTTPAAVAPSFLGEQRIYSGRGKHKKVIGFEFLFSGGLNAALADSTGNYRVTQARGKRVNNLSVISAGYSFGNDSITLAVAGYKANKPAQVTIVGLAGANGAAIGPITSGL